MADITITCTKHGTCIIEGSTDVGKRRLKELAWRMEKNNCLLVPKGDIEDWLEIFRINEVSYEGI
jgi:hypothetical protein